MKYEYQYEVRDRTMRDSELDAFGEEGWELCGITRGVLTTAHSSWFSTPSESYFFYFKRAITNKE